MVRLWWLWWPQPARPPPQRWRQAAEHSEAPPRGCAATARHHMERVVDGCAVEEVVYTVGGNGVLLHRMKMISRVAVEVWYDGVCRLPGERTETASHVRCAVCAAAMNEWGDEDTAVGGGEA
ncbi:hypothetical protein Tco_0533009 [Tanacetum coccineum]